MATSPNAGLARNRLPGCLHPKLRAWRASLTTEDSSEALPQTEGRAQGMKNEVVRSAAWLNITKDWRQYIKRLAGVVSRHSQEIDACIQTREPMTRPPAAARRVHRWRAP